VRARIAAWQTALFIRWRCWSFCAPRQPTRNRGLQAELWGDEQWQALKTVIDERNPRVIGINRSTVFAFSDGLSSGELQGMSAALGEKWTSRFKNAEGLPLELIASRLPEEEAFFGRLQELVWSMTQEMFSSKVIAAGTTKTSDLVWWWRQRVNDLGLGTWFQPSVDVQRKGASAEQLGDDPVIQPGDVLHCDVGLTVARLNTDTQHLAYVLRPGETEAPAGLRQALAHANALQDIVMSELRPGRSGNEILAASLARMRAQKIEGTVYSHPIGLYGHGAGPLIGLWDYQDGVPGRGDEINRVEDGKHYGWPYFIDNNSPNSNLTGAKRSLKPEEATPPALALPAHSSPIDLRFYTGNTFPAPYRGAMFVALHGSSAKARKEKIGYKVVRIIFKEGKPAGVEDFVTGWLKDDQVLGRPAGLITGADGALYISDDNKGFVYRVSYGKK
jgi:Glucose / Sorbosone dehydrogenase/Metallopeptidase family M24